MASVTLSNIHLALASDLSAAIQFGGSATSEKSSKSGEVRRYANGRRRLITRAAEPLTIEVTIPMADAALVDSLRGYVGRLIFFRDTFGRKEYGTYFDLNVSEELGFGRSSVSFRIDTTSDTEEV